ncbi:hypothetical protein ACFX12_008068 [Malus domestica]
MSPRMGWSLPWNWAVAWKRARSWAKASGRAWTVSWTGWARTRGSGLGFEGIVLELKCDALELGLGLGLEVGGLGLGLEAGGLGLEVDGLGFGLGLGLEGDGLGLMLGDGLETDKVGDGLEACGLVDGEFWISLNSKIQDLN